MPKLLAVMPPGNMVESVGVELSGRKASLDEVEFGLSISMLVGASPLTLLL